jgi:hypothetical protein
LRVILIKPCTFLVVLILLLTGCGLETTSLQQEYDGDLEEVSKIVLLDGNTGYRKEIQKEEQVRDFLEKIKTSKFIPDSNQEPRDGFNYSITLLEDDEAAIQFTLTEMKGHYYHTEPDLFPIVDEFYKRLEIEEQGFE